MDKGELVGPIAKQADDNLLASTRDKNAMKWIGDRTCSQCLAAGSEAGGVSLTSLPVSKTWAPQSEGTAGITPK